MRTTRAASAIAALFFYLSSPIVHGGIIPFPASTVAGVGQCDIDAATQIFTPRRNDAARAAADYLIALWYRTNSLRLRVSDTPLTTHRGGPCRIVFEQTAGFSAEGYRVQVKQEQITLSASTSAGLFYGAVTLWQLLPTGSSRGTIAAQTIDDSPRFAWRGLLLDSVRHFQSVSFIHSMIDWMAWHKLNVLHWHLTDDQGWRLQIRRYPKLTSVGAWRGDYGGFYTQLEVAEIVRFAQRRHVQIIPEIDMPGHATAAVAAYPELGSSPEALTVSGSWGVHKHLFNVEPQTFEFLDHVLDEVMQLFPGRFIHVGGDEAVKDEWIASAQVQSRMRDLGIKDPAALQAYFTGKMAQYLQTHGRRLVGWDEILTPNMPNSTVVMSWHGVSGAHDAAVAGNDTVLTPQPVLYFDRRQSTLPSEPPGRLEVSSLQDVYGFDPSVAGLDAAQQARVLGVQANIWTEHIQTERRVEWMAFPRAAAVAEIAWSPDPSASQRTWQNFAQRLVPMFSRYQAFGLAYADSAFGIGDVVTDDGIELSAPQAPANAVIRYTVDGKDPTLDSAEYSTALPLRMNSEIRAATFLNGQRASRIFDKHIDAHTASRRSSHQLQLCTQKIGLLLQPAHGQTSDGEPLAIDIMNPCWIYPAVDLTQAVTVSASVASVPFNYEIGKDAAAIKIGDAHSTVGEMEVHVDSCDAPILATLALPAKPVGFVTELPSIRIAADAHPGIVGRHDICLRFARPRLDPMWALDWIELGT
jgi:hexosaminidase